jgi:hypothetical protein
MEKNSANQHQFTKSPEKKRQKDTYNIVSVDDFDKCVIRNTIQDSVHTEEIFSCPQVVTSNEIKNTFSKRMY